MNIFDWHRRRHELERLIAEVDELACRRLGADPSAAEADAVSRLRSLRELLATPSEPSPRESPESEPAPSPSPSADRLIRLRDTLLMRIRVDDDPATDVLRSVDKELGAILALEGIVTLDERGRFNPELQQALETWEAGSADEDDTVCETVRPGYKKDGVLLRPQEVVVRAYHGDGE